MTPRAYLKLATAAVSLAALTACGGLGSGGSGGSGLFRSGGGGGTLVTPAEPDLERNGRPRTTIWDALRDRDDGRKVGVNRYLWNASLEVLDFLPVQTVDPFTGVIVTGYGTPPGGGRAYRATVYIKDPALDARSLNVAIQTRGGPVAVGTQRAVEDAILTRARQLRQQDTRF